MNRFLLLFLSSVASVAAATVVHEVVHEVLSSAAPPFFTAVQRAQLAVRALRRNQRERAVVNVKGVCELAATLTLGAADSNTRFVGAPGAMLSAGVELRNIEAAAEAGAAVTVDLAKHGFSAANLGTLAMRGCAGGSACIDVQNFEPSAAELFFRPPAPPPQPARARTAPATPLRAACGSRASRTPHRVCRPPRTGRGSVR